MMMKLGIMKMSETNLAEEAENFDVTAEVKASTVMSETEVQETVTSNVNNNNKEGDLPLLNLLFCYCR